MSYIKITKVIAIDFTRDRWFRNIIILSQLATSSKSLSEHAATIASTRHPTESLLHGNMHPPNNIILSLLSHQCVSIIMNAASHFCPYYRIPKRTCMHEAQTKTEKNLYALLVDVKKGKFRMHGDSIKLLYC